VRPEYTAPHLSKRTQPSSWVAAAERLNVRFAAGLHVHSHFHDFRFDIHPFQYREKQGLNERFAPRVEETTRLDSITSVTHKK
jgi:hypothetical protein